MELNKEQKEQIRLTMINTVANIYNTIGFSFISDNFLRMAQQNGILESIDVLKEIKEIIKDEDKPNYNALLKALLEKAYNNFKLNY